VPFIVENLILLLSILCHMQTLTKTTPKHMRHNRNSCTLCLPVDPLQATKKVTIQTPWMGCRSYATQPHHKSSANGPTCPSLEWRHNVTTSQWWATSQVRYAKHKKMNSTGRLPVRHTLIGCLVQHFHLVVSLTRSTMLNHRPPVFFWTQTYLPANQVLCHQYQQANGRYMICWKSLRQSAHMYMSGPLAVCTEQRCLAGLCCV
jgi:hypothetical protein